MFFFTGCDMGSYFIQFSLQSHTTLSCIDQRVDSLNLEASALAGMEKNKRAYQNVVKYFHGVTMPVGPRKSS
jgi:hypothetical protein